MRALLLPLLLLLPLGARGGELPQEFQVKANYLVALPMFVDFPVSTQKSPAFTLGLVGETPLAEALGAMKGKQVKNRPLAIRLVRELQDLEDCQVLFIASSEHYRLQVLLAGAGNRGILTISDMRDFVRMGGMVGLVTVNHKITFELNQGAARGAGLSFGTQLLKLASDVSR